MAQALPFADVLDAADQLTPDEQETLVEILRRRLAAEGRKRVVADVQEARREFAGGRCVTTNVDDLLREIES
jgi:hypothetical protein